MALTRRNVAGSPELLATKSDGLSAVASAAASGYATGSVGPPGHQIGCSASARVRRVAECHDFACQEMPFTELALSRRNPSGSKWNGPRPHNRLRDPPETHASAGSPHRQPTSKSRTQLRCDPARTTDDLRCTLLRSGVGVVLSAVEHADRHCGTSGLSY